MKKVTFVARPSATTPAVSADDWVTDQTPVPEPAKPAAAAEPIKRLTIDIPLGLHRRVKTGCVREDTPIADVVRSFLERRFPAEPSATTEGRKSGDTETR